MKRHSIRGTIAISVAALAAGVALGAPALADPPSGSSTTVDMPLPGTAGHGSDNGFQPAPVTLTEQNGTGGVDRDGTDGVIDPDGTNGTVTGPLLRATPEIRANPAPLSPRVQS